MKTKIIKIMIVLSLFTVLLVTGCSGDAVIPAIGITVSSEGNVTTIDTVGGTLQMYATVEPADATNLNVVWSVINGTGTASINESGLVTALTNGTVTIKAVSEDFELISGTFEITITNQTDTIESANKTVLTSAVNAANTNKNTAVVSADGTDVSPEDQWVTSAVMVSYSDAIEDAQLVLDNESATQLEVNGAVSDIDAATTTFNSAKADGTQTANKSVLINSVSAANANKLTVAVSVDGTDVAPENQWVTSAVMADYTAAIADAQIVLDNEAATQLEVNGAVSVLDAATTTFNSAKAYGTMASSSEARLSDVSVDGTSIVDFSLDIENYTLTLPYGTTLTPLVEGTPINVDADIQITPATDVTSATEADRTTTIVVTSQDTLVEKTYTVLFLVGPNQIDLGMAGDFAILACTGISTTAGSEITGDLGISSYAASYITGFGLTMDLSGTFSTSALVNGRLYAADYTAPTPSNLTTAVANMITAYNTAAGVAVNYNELHAGDLSGKTLQAGVYKWTNNVLINTNVTLSGSENDVWIFQIAGSLTQASGISVILSGGAQAKNIFWQVADTVTIGTNAHFEGIVLAQTNAVVMTNSSMNGRLLVQTAVTLDNVTVISPMVNKVALDDLIISANANVLTAEVSVDGTDILPENKWVTAAVMLEYTTAIEDAQTISDDLFATQTQVNQAVIDLIAATETFNTAKADGTMVV